MPTKVIALPAEEYVEETSGETAYRPKYTDDDRVDGYNSALVPAPGGWPGTTTPGNQIFIAGVTATQGAIDDAQAAADVWAVGNEAADDVTPDQVADFLNRQFRVDTSILPDTVPAEVAELIDGLVDAIGERAQPQTADEWFEQLGIDTGN